MLSHSRFTPFRIGLLNALWLGIPVIHNSPILKEVHPTLDSMFYFGNSISGISDCFSRFSSGGIADFISSVDSIRSSILEKWSIAKNLKGWEQICSSLSLSSPSVSSFSLSSPSVTSIPTVVPVAIDTSTITSNEKTIIIAFSDMWPGFNYNSNFIMDALRNECKTSQIVGEEYIKDTTPNLLIFGPYSYNWKMVPDSIPKIYFSAENWTKPNSTSIKLFLTSSRIEDETHMRIPTWMTFIDWFSGSKTLPENINDNPIRIPLHFAVTPHSTLFKDREDFCAFVVSNPICSFRNETFKAINEYKKVNSGGALYNNIGGQLSLKYAGGGCGDISKYNFFSRHKFTISFENSQADGYITEKVLHAKMAGCVPLYWGDKDTNTDFVNGSIVNLSMFDNPEQILEVIKKLEENPDLCSKIATTPILNNEKKQAALDIISKIAKKLIEIARPSSQVSSMPSGIDKIFVINLDTRHDRLESLMKAEPYLKNIITRISAINGKTLKMNQFIYNLFNKNQFQWKKSVIGCNLSHITTWSKIIKEPGEYFLILEDDVRFKKDWLEQWDKCAKYIPEDADILYLGGVLPPNKAVLPKCMEQVNEHWCQIIPNSYFSLVPLPIFHFCAYSYILTKRGAKKVLDYLNNSDLKSYTISDHLLGSPNVGLKKYFTNPLLSYCFQEDDPIYLNSQFNDLHRQDTFDSDIWNNTECFTKSELAPYETTTIYYLSNELPKLYETQWIDDIFPKYTLKCLTNLITTIEDNSWCLVQRPFLEAWTQIFNNFLIQNTHFKVLHLSDEFCKDSLDFYTLPNCKGVIRNYLRADTPEVPHIITVPLGYHHKGINNSAFLDRKLVWSFHGNCWFDRKSKLEQLYSFVPHNCHTVNEWNASNMSKQNQYLSILADSKFCPILKGNNIETFRLYEALEVGTIPIYVRHEGDELFWNKISSKLGLLELENWTQAKDVIQNFLDNPDKGEKYQMKLSEAWTKWKAEIKLSCQALL